MPRAVGCELRTNCSWIDSACTDVKETPSKVVDDGQCNRNEEE